MYGGVETRHAAGLDGVFGGWKCEGKGGGKLDLIWGSERNQKERRGFLVLIDTQGIKNGTYACISNPG